MVPGSSEGHRLLRERIRKSRSTQELQTFEDWDHGWEDMVPVDSRHAPLDNARLIVVANRLPVTCSKDPQGRWRLQVRRMRGRGLLQGATHPSGEDGWGWGSRRREGAGIGGASGGHAEGFAHGPAGKHGLLPRAARARDEGVRGGRRRISAGGLVSALMGVGNYTTLWVGWPGIYVRPGRDRDALAAMLQKEGYVPVWLEPQLLDLYYNGFCNSVLWQLFHYVPLNMDGWQRMTEHHTMQMQWQAYSAANDRFGEVVLAHYQGGDMVWVQDYHLMLLPQLLKQGHPKMKARGGRRARAPRRALAPGRVGWFLHTPFPSSEIYRTLPVREEVLRAVLKADLIGFHTYDYARHFISSCTRILGLEGTPEGVEDNGSITRVAAFPIGIDPERFTAALEAEEVQGNIAKLLNRYAGRKVMLGVDRLDMIKGIPQKLLAFEKFLQEHPEWRDKVLLVQIAVPSRTDVPEYQRLRSMVHEIVGRINGAFGTLTYVPIHHLDRQLSFHELCALYAVTDVALINSLRDGMNLVSYEYVACQSDNAGVLVLSEFAGAAQSLGAGAILVNPWNAIEDALTMSEEERRERHRQNYMHVATHTAQARGSTAARAWADTFISELNDTHIEADLRLRHTPPDLNLEE
ncbi:alpha,alpha-trehalose-phosphate synthase (UDP-forming), partial [Monoraphidium neglectum]